MGQEEDFQWQTAKQQVVLHSFEETKEEKQHDMRLLALFNNNLFSYCHVPGLVLGVKDIKVNKIGREAYILAKEIMNK